MWSQAPPQPTNQGGPPVRGPPPAYNAGGGWGSAPPNGHQYHHDEDSSEDEGALSSTINLVTSAASMFFKPAAPRPQPPPQPSQSPLRKTNGPPPPIDPTTSMLDMGPPAATASGSSPFATSPMLPPQAPIRANAFGGPPRTPTAAVAFGVHGPPPMQLSATGFPPLGDAGTLAMSTKGMSPQQNISQPSTMMGISHLGYRPPSQPPTPTAHNPNIYKHPSNPPTPTASNPPVHFMPSSSASTANPRVMMPSLAVTTGRGPPPTPLSSQAGSAPPTPVGAFSGPPTSITLQQSPRMTKSTAKYPQTAWPSSPRAAEPSLPTLTGSQAAPPIVTKPPTPTTGSNSIDRPLQTINPKESKHEPAVASFSHLETFPKATPPSSPRIRPSTPETPRMANQTMSPRNGLPPASPRLSQDGAPAVASAVTAKKQHEPSLSFSATTPSADRDTTPLGRNTSSPGRYSSPGSGIRRQLRVPPKAEVSPRGTLHRPKFRLPPARKPRTNTPLSTKSSDTQQEFRVTPSSTPTSESYKWPLGLTPSALSVGENSESVSRSVNKVIPASPLATSNLSKEKFPSAVEYSTVLPDNALPNGWTEAEDPTSGRKYYYNSDTQETSWARPKPVTVQGSTSVEDHMAEPSSDKLVVDATAMDLVENDCTAVRTAVPEVNGAANEGLLDSWAEALDPSSGRLTNETSCTWPVAPPSTDEPGLSPTTDGHGREETVIDATAAAADTAAPVEESVASLAATSDFPSSEPPQSDALSTSIPAPWTAVEDDSGQTYYYNAITGETSWDLPEQSPVSENAEEPPGHSWGEQNTIATNETETLDHEEPTMLQTSDDVFLTADGIAVPEPQPEMPPMPPGWIEVIDEASGCPYYFNTFSEETSWERPVTEIDEQEEGGVALDTTMELLDESNPAASRVEVSDGTDSRTPPVESKHVEVSDTSETEPPGASLKVPADVEDEEPLTEEPRIDSSTSATKEIAITHDTNLLEENDGPTEGDSPALADNWEGALDPGTGNMYYYNSVTGETSWERPLKIIATHTEVPVDDAAEEAAETSTSEDMGIAEEPTHCSALVTEEVAEHAEIDEGPIGLADSSEPVPESYLPSEWSEAVDPSSGLRYYYNSITQATSWERPVRDNMGEEAGVDDTPDRVEEEEPLLEEEVDPISLQQEPINDSDRAELTTPDQGPTVLAESPELVPESDLPSEWSEAVDPSSGLTYYYNSITQATSWEHPVRDNSDEAGVDDAVADNAADSVEEEEPPLEEEVDPVSLQQEPINESDRAELTTPDQEPIILAESPELVPESDLTSEWSEAVDPSSGLTYYYNSVTQATSWERPVRENVGDETGVDDSLAYEAEGAVDDEGPNLEEVDPVSGRQEPIKENNRVDPVGEGNSAYNLAEGIVDSSLPDGWQEVVDPSSGQTYFYNAATVETSWERPAGTGMPQLCKVNIESLKNAQHEEQLDETGVEGNRVNDLNTDGQEEPPFVEKPDRTPVSSNLPEGWTEVTDPSSSRIYYYNPITEETSWDFPVATERAEDGQDETSVDEDHSVTSVSTYGGELEGESTHTNPAGDTLKELDSTGLSPTDLPEGWMEKVDPYNGSKYYYNTITYETSYGHPLRDESETETGHDDLTSVEDEDHLTPAPERFTDEAAGSHDFDETEGTGTEPTQEAPSPPPGWLEVVDPSSGQLYYYNSITEETSWELPPKMVPLADEAILDGGDDALDTNDTDQIQPDYGLTSELTSLPDGWTESVDPSSGQTYFYNSITEETSWERPVVELSEREGIFVEETALVEEEDQTSYVAEDNDTPAEEMDAVAETGETTVESSGITLPEGWTEVEDPSSGQLYYYNSITQEASWERPTGGLDQDLDEDEIPETSSSLEENQPFDSDAITKVQAPVPEEDGPSGAADVDEYTSGGLSSTGQENSDRPVAESLGPVDAYGTDDDAPTADEHAPSDLVVSQAFHVDMVEETRAPEETGSTSHSLQEGWVELLDPSSGQTYYYNGTTEETSWERPVLEIDAVVHEEPETAAEPLESSWGDMDFEKVYGSPEAVPVENSDVYTANDASDAAGSEVDFSMSKNVSLPTGWIENEDPQSGEMYYYNSATGETTWEIPSTGNVGNIEDTPAVNKAEIEEVLAGDGSERSIMPAIPPLESEGGETSLPGDWAEAIDPQTGLTYYVNTVTQVTSWDHPGLLEEKDRAEGGEDDQKLVTTEEDQPFGDGPEAVHDIANEGETYNSRHDVKQSPNEPDVYGQPELADIDAERTVEDITDEPGETTLPAGWTEHVDPDSGEIFFYNADRDVTSWDRPTDKIEEAVAEAKLLAGDGPADGDDSVPPVEEPKVTESIDAVNDMQELVDEASGATSYCNVATDTTTRERPVSSAQAIGADFGETASRYDSASVPDATLRGEEPSSTANAPEELNRPYAIQEPESTLDYEGDGPMSENLELLAQLPPGWVQLLDSNSGIPYFFCEADGTTTWDKPVLEESTDVTLEEMPGASPEIVDGGEGIASANEPEYVDSPEEERPEYAPEMADRLGVGPSAEGPPMESDVDVLSRVEDYPSTLVQSVSPYISDMPEGERSDRASQKEVLTQNEKQYVEEELPRDWEEVEDPSSGEIYYYNRETNTTSWTIPMQGGEEQDGGDDSKGEETAASELDPGWVELVDPNSGQTYYFNEIENRTSWDRPGARVSGPSSLPSTVPIFSEMNGTGTDRSRPAHALGIFAFGGRLVTLNGQPSDSMQVVIRRAKGLIETDPVSIVEREKQQCAISGPLNSAADELVFSYIERKVESQPEDLLWHLILIAAKSKGRLRSVEGVADQSSPEAAVVELLLRDDMSCPSGEVRLERASPRKEKNEKPYSAESVQNLLLRGRRHEAVNEAIRYGDYATGLLVASLCDHATYQRVAKQYAEKVFLKGSPLYTVALLFSGQLQAPASGQTSLWGGSPDELVQNWRYHLAAIVSNRMGGWDRIVLTLGDRLLELDYIQAAHFCFMVCGCPITSPTSKDSRVALLGCEHSSSMNMALRTEVSILAYARTEAFEWAKRLGNRNAAIKSLQPFKLIYAMLLADHGYEVSAELLTQSIRRCTDAAQSENGKSASPSSLSMLFEDPVAFTTTLSDLEHRLQFRKDPSYLFPLAMRSGKEAGEAKAGAGVTLLNDGEPVEHRVNTHTDPHAVSSSIEEQERSHRSREPKEPLAKPTNEKSHAKSLQRKVQTTPGPLEQPVSFEPPECDNPDATADVSFLSAKSNLMDITGYSLDIYGKEVPPASSRVDRKQQSPPPRQGKPPIKQAEPATPIAKLTSSQPLIKPVEPATPIAKSTSQPPILTSTPREAKESTKMPPSVVTPRGDPKPIDQAPSSAPPVMVGNKNNTPKAKASPLSSGVTWGSGFRKRMIKIFNPNATEVSLEESSEKPYYDDKLKVWVFPGENPEELAKPIGPPPTTPGLGAGPPAVTADESKAVANDPLAMMMAPPKRGPSGPRGLPSSGTPARGYPGMPSPAMGPPMLAPPQFAVFQLKPAEAVAAPAPLPNPDESRTE